MIEREVEARGAERVWLKKALLLAMVGRGDLGMVEG